MVVNAPAFVPLVLYNTCFKSHFLYKFLGILRLDLNLLPHSSPSGKFWLILFTLAAAVVQATAPVDALS